MFSGELVIGQPDLIQGELLPGQTPGAASVAGLDISGEAPQPLPAT